MANMILLPAAVLFGCLSFAPSPASMANQPALVPGTGVTIYAAGDIADCYKYLPAASGAGKTARLIAAGLERDAGAAVLSLGDHTYPDGLLKEFTECYDPTWGRFKERTYPAPGNHEYYTPEAIGYYRYFERAAGPDRRGYYSFNLGTWHIVSLNSNLRDADHRRQVEWLKDDLARHPSRCTLAYWHHPLFSSGGHGNNPHVRDLWQALEAAGADVVLVSHDHDYERFARQDSSGRLDEQRGMRSFVVGTGGARLTRFLFRKANSEVTDNSTHGVLRMTLKETGYEWAFLPVAGGGFSDRGATLCH
jgi:hypothetical protein